MDRSTRFADNDKRYLLTLENIFSKNIILYFIEQRLQRLDR